MKDEALEFVAEAAKELFVFQLEEKQSAEQMNEVETFNSQQSSLKNSVEEFALLSNEFYNSDKLSEEVMNSPLFEIVVTSILNFQIGEGLDKVFLLDKLVKSDVISQDLFLDKVSQFIQMEEDALFSDIDVLKTLIKRFPSLEVIKTGFNKSSKTKVKNFIELLGGLIVRLGSEELVFLLNESFFGSK